MYTFIDMKVELCIAVGTGKTIQVGNDVGNCPLVLSSITNSLLVSSRNTSYVKKMKDFPGAVRDSLQSPFLCHSIYIGCDIQGHDFNITIYDEYEGKYNVTSI